MNRLISIIIFLSLIFPIIAFGDIKDCGGGNQLPQKSADPQVSLGDLASMQMVIQRSVDPNELDGPRGVDSVRWVSKNDVLNYTIFFENDPEFATAWAQIVDVRFDFPDERLVSDFKLGNYSFANRSYDIPDDASFYSMRLDCRDSLKVYADIVAGVEAEKKQAYWHFSSIDPETGYEPWQVDRGLLPVNDSTHIGEGFVTFTLKPHEEMVTGDTISFYANIVFDSNDTLQTNRWCNRIDAGNPISTVKAVVDQDNYSHYRLNFTGEDDRNGSGLNRVFLYLADNLGTYEEYAVCPVYSVLDFYVEQGKQYNFMSIAEDRVGNREPLKTKPDLTLNFNLPPTDIQLSNSTFQDDILMDGFIGELSSVDTEDDIEFTYALAEGEGAVHNEMFSIVGNRLQANDCFKCSEETIFNIRISTTDDGGLSYSKPFTLILERVLEAPEPKTIEAQICEGDEYEFYGEFYDKTGTYQHRVENEFMCDSVYILNLRVNPIPEPPTITVTGKSTLVSSAELGNQWYFEGDPIEGATEKTYTATETGVYYVTASNGTCESNHSEEYYVDLTPSSQVDISLTSGWNWISSNFSDSDVKSPNVFFSSILNNVNTILGENGELSNSNGSLTGSLNSIEASTYKVNTTVSGQLSLSAAQYEPEDFEISLHNGWNWIPYIPTIEMSVDMALSNLSPSENDIIKSHTEFATFANGKWQGTLSNMMPYSGYMYYSGKSGNFKFNESRARQISVNPLSENSTVTWPIFPEQYADNMTIVASLKDKDADVIPGIYSVGAFCGDECRGIGQYVDDRLFITVHGSTGQKITFKAIENATGKDCKIKEECYFDEMPVGTISTPMVLTLGEESGIANVYADSDFTIYPNPVRDILFVDGDLSQVTGVKIIAMNGATLITVKNVEHGVNVANIPDGVYVAAIETELGMIYKKFIKKL